MVFILPGVAIANGTYRYHILLLLQTENQQAI